MNTPENNALFRRTVALILMIQPELTGYLFNSLMNSLRLLSKEYPYSVTGILNTQTIQQLADYIEDNWIVEGLSLTVHNHLLLVFAMFSPDVYKPSTLRFFMRDVFEDNGNGDQFDYFNKWVEEADKLVTYHERAQQEQQAQLERANAEAYNVRIVTTDNFEEFWDNLRLAGLVRD